VGERAATRGFYGNGGGVARNNLVIGIATTTAAAAVVVAAAAAAAGTGWILFVSLLLSSLSPSLAAKRQARRTEDPRDAGETRASAK